MVDHPERQRGDVPAPVAPRAPRAAPRRAAVLGVRTADDVMDRRPPTVDQDASLWGAWGRLRGAACRHLVVVDRQLHPVGVLEERDLALRWPPGPFEAHRVPLRRLVRGGPRPLARSGDDQATVARTMLVACTDAVPAVDDGGRLLGLVTARHCVELVARRGVA